jgi:integrase
MPPALEAELRAYIEVFKIVEPTAYLFPSDVGAPYDPHNYLARKLKSLAKRAQVAGVNFQVFRRTCATHFQEYGGKVKDAQALLRHTNAGP